jgi:hypothetical protein
MPERTDSMLHALRSLVSRLADGFFPGAIRFQKYRVAPRLGNDRVRRRILLGAGGARTRSLAASGGSG